MVRGLRTIEDNDPPQTPSDYLAHSWGEDSRWRMQARLDPESGAVVEAALEAVASKENLSAAQALVRMSEIAQAALNDSGTPSRELRGDERAAVVIHIDAPARPQPDRDHNGSPEPVSATETTRRPNARIADGPGLPDHVAQRLLCSGRVRAVLWARCDDRSDVLDLGRSHRVVSGRQFRALLLRDGGCTHPGGPATRGLQAHHVRHWLHGGPTNLGNLLLLCQRHHHPRQLGEFTITAPGSGRFQFLRPDQRVLPDVVDPSAFIHTATPLEDEHAHLATDAAASRWTGDRLHHPYAIACLATSRASAA